MTTSENTAQDSTDKDFSFKSCEEMMKMMRSFMEGKGEKVDFEQFCGKMSDFCKKMMKGGAQS